MCVAARALARMRARSSRARSCACARRRKHQVGQHLLHVPPLRLGRRRDDADLQRRRLPLLLQSIRAAAAAAAASGDDSAEPGRVGVGVAEEAAQDADGGEGAVVGGGDGAALSLRQRLAQCRVEVASATLDGGGGGGGGGGVVVRPPRGAVALARRCVVRAEMLQEDDGDGREEGEEAVAHLAGGECIVCVTGKLLSSAGYRAPDAACLPKAVVGRVGSKHKQQPERTAKQRVVLSIKPKK